MSDDENLEIVSDSEDSMYKSSSEEGERCYCCNDNLEYEDNEYYDWTADRYYCERCWFDIEH